jgi:hypothetical protein
MPIKLPAPYIVQPDGSSDGVGVQQDLDALASAVPTPDQRRVFFASNATSVNLGNFDGENITGIRISANLRSASSMGPMFLRPNGLTSMPTQWISHRAWSDNVGLFTDVQGLIPITAAQPGMQIAAADFGVTDSAIHFDGIFFTSRLAGAHYRRYIGQYSNMDYQVNSSRSVSASIRVTWGDPFTTVSSLALACSTGNFSGRIALEIVP